MNNRLSKKLRRQAEKKLFEWYQTLLEEEIASGLTQEMALEYTPYVSYWFETHEMTARDGTEYISQQAHISDHTHRWFIRQEKKNYGKLYSTT